MLEFARGLSDRAVRGIAELEERVVAADGGRLKLEWRVLESRSGPEVEDLLWWDGERCLGFLGLYVFDAPTVEIAGMVDPEARRGGIATALLDAALLLCLERAYDRALLVTPRSSAGGRAFARARGAALEHSEHALVLDGPPVDGPVDPELHLRLATAADAGELGRVLSAAFGAPAGDMAAWLAQDTARTIVVERHGAIVATVRLTREKDEGRIYGFAVDPPLQGRGIGRDVLRRVCRQLREQGAGRVGLEVAVDNDHALGLYTSLGFAHVTTEDYYELPLCLHS
jgi:ribosomal protein S18 acetylase RimI-like enzyme